MAEMVSFHVLQRKFLEQDKDVPAPEEAQQVLYYSLAIGHHVGVIDCLNKVFECPVEAYEAWIAQLPDGPARRKMAGLLTYGEIYIDLGHAALLGNAWRAIRDDLSEPFKEWTTQLLEILAAMVREPARYLMIQRPRRMA